MNPGETTTVKLSFTMHEGMDGPHEFLIVLKPNDPDVPEKLLSVKASFFSESSAWPVPDGD